MACPAAHSWSSCWAADLESGTPDLDVTTPRRGAGAPLPLPHAPGPGAQRPHRAAGVRGPGAPGPSGGGARYVGEGGGSVGSARSASGRLLQPPPPPPPRAAALRRFSPLLSSSRRGSATGARTNHATLAGSVSAAPRPGREHADCARQPAARRRRRGLAPGPTSSRTQSGTRCEDWAGRGAEDRRGEPAPRSGRTAGEGRSCGGGARRVRARGAPLPPAACPTAAQGGGPWPAP